MMRIFNRSVEAFHDLRGRLKERLLYRQKQMGTRPWPKTAKACFAAPVLFEQGRDDPVNAP
ncbi:hypothetical protein ACC811_37330, partial [Rhizobium ruizarguesonis]